jgi:hypothetical protein
MAPLRPKQSHPLASHVLDVDTIPVVRDAG